VKRFGGGSQVASYLGFVPEEDSSGEHRRLGQIRKQGNARLRFLLVEGAQVTVRSDPQWRGKGQIAILATLACDYSDD
jgi:transposase